MIPEVVSVVFFVCITTLTLKAFTFKRRNFLPPGPRGLPIIGYLHKLGSQPLHMVLSELSEKYGDIFSLQLGSRLTVVLQSKDAIYEAFVKKAKQFAGRPDLATFNKTRHGATGISMCDFTDDYKKNKQMAMKAFHKLYTNKSQFNQILRDEATKMTDLFEELISKNKAFDPSLQFDKVSPSIMVHVMFGKNFEYNQPDIVSLVQFNRKWFESAEANNPADFFKILERCPNKRLNAIEQSALAFYKFIFQKMEEYESEDCTGLFGSYMSQYRERFGGESLTENEKFELARCVADLLGGGFDTLSATLCWAILNLNDNPKVVEKCRKEMKCVIGEREARIEDIDSLPYTTAMIYELLRYVSTAPMGLPRKTTEEVKIRDFIIPKDTMVFANLWASNNEQGKWKNPQEFDPENFLNEDGKFNIKALRGLASFSSGVRRCPAERFSILQLFILLTTILQKYDIQMVNQPKDYLPQGGLTVQPKHFTIKLAKRCFSNQ